MEWLLIIHVLVHTRCCTSLENAAGGCRVVPSEGLWWGHCLLGLHVSGKASLEKVEQTDPNG